MPPSRRFKKSRKDRERKKTLQITKEELKFLGTYQKITNDKYSSATFREFKIFLVSFNEAVTNAEF